MARIRIIFEKRGLFTFVNHMDLPVVFSRAARRAGLVQEFTQGFSPHPRISLAPPLAIGVEGMAEPADFWFEKWDSESCSLWNAMLPEGLKILKWAETAEGPALAKSIDAALYRIEGNGTVIDERAAELLGGALSANNALWSCGFSGGAVELAAGDLERCGGGLFVKTLAEAGLVSGWPDLLMTRLTVGRWDDESRAVLPLI